MPTYQTVYDCYIHTEDDTHQTLYDCYILTEDHTHQTVCGCYIHTEDHTHTSLHDFGLGLKETRFSCKALHFHASFGEIQTVATASNMFSLFFSPFLILMLLNSCIRQNIA